jgi:hypothetical protein
VSVGVGGVEFESLLVVSDGEGGAAEFFVEVGEVEVGEGVFVVGEDGLLVVLFGFAPFAGVEVDGADVDECAGEVGVEFEGFFVGGDGFSFVSTRGLDFEGALEPDFGISQRLGGLGFGSWKGEEAAEFGLIEIEKELAGEGFHLLAFGLDADAFAFDVDAEFFEGIGGAGEFAVDALEDCSEFGGGDAEFFEAGEDAEFEEVFEGVFFFGSE